MKGKTVWSLAIVLSMLVSVMPLVSVKAQVVPPEHELAVSLDAPTSLVLGESSWLNATVSNQGLSNETDVELFLLINGSLSHSETIPELLAGSSHTYHYEWAPIAEGIHNVTAYAPPVPDEINIANNLVTEFVTVVRPLIHPQEGQYANYTLTISSMGQFLYNITYNHYINSTHIYVDMWFKDLQTNMTMTQGITLDIMNRSYIQYGMPMGYWPFLIETNVTVGSTVKIFNTIGNVTGSRFIEIGDFLVDSWELHCLYYAYYSVNYTLWFDKVNGLLIAFEGAGVNYTESGRLVATNMPLVYLPRPRIQITPESGPVGTEVMVVGNATFNGQVEISWENSFLGNATADENGNFNFTLTVPPSTRGSHTITVMDLTTNVSDTAVFTILPSISSITPNSGPIGAQVQVTGLGFGANELVALFFEDMPIAEVFADEDGNFTATFNIPLAQSGSYVVKAWYGDQYVQTAFNVTDISPLDVDINVGAIHFKGEIAEFYVLVSNQGEPINATISAILYYNGKIYKDLSASVGRFGLGLYRISYTIPSTASSGTYTLVVEAHYLTHKGISLESFLLSPTLTGWNALLVSINGTVATIKTDVGVIKVDINNIKLNVTAINGNIATIKTDIGILKADTSFLKDGQQFLTTSLYVLMAPVLLAVGVILVACLLYLFRRKPSQEQQSP